MKRDGLRNFTVRFLESALERVETTAKPFYGGRLSTGEAIRRLAEERLNEIETKDAVEQGRNALLRVLSDWRSGRVLPIADIRFIADGANAAYRRCRSDFVVRDLVIANVSAFRDAVKRAGHAKGGRGVALESRYYLDNPTTCAGKIEAKTVVAAVDKWIALLPAVVAPVQAEPASRNLSAFLRNEDCPDEAQLGRALQPYLSSLLQLAIRAYWYQERRALLSPGEESPSARPRYMRPIEHGSITIEPLVRDHELTLSLELPGKQSVVSANNLPEVEELRDATRLALAGHDIRGDVFHWSKQLEDPNRFTLSTEHGSWMLEASDVCSIGQALDLLFHEPSIVGVAERGRFVYGRV